MNDRSLRAEVIATATQMNALGLNQGTSGNVSVRVPGGFLITPSGVAYERMQPEEIVLVGLDGSIREGEQGGAAARRPSSEWRMHLGIFAGRPEVSAILHAHALYSTTLSCLRRDIPAFHYMIAIAGGDSIRCASYATFGSDALAESALAALRGRKACLLANHGMIAVEKSLSAVLELAREVETLAAQYVQALQIGEPHVLDSDEMARVLSKFRSYGKL